MHVLGGVLVRCFRILIVLELQVNVPHGSVSSQTIALTTAVFSFYLPPGSRLEESMEKSIEDHRKSMGFR